MKIYRILTGDGSSTFCHKVSLALSKGWELHGSPTMTFDSEKGELVCGQAVVKEIDGVYDPSMRLGDQ